MLTCWKNILLIFIFQYSQADPASWSIAIPYPDGTRRVIHIPFNANKEETAYSDTPSSSCRNCFYFRTVDAGRRLLAEPCGGADCVAIVNSTLPQEILPTIKYDFDQCGTVISDNYPKVKALQMKVSTSAKNTLRPAEYPWLVRIESRSNAYSRTVTLCGGTLIHPQWIITAAHCMFDSKTDRLYPTYGVNLYMGHYNRVSSSRTEHVAKPAFYILHPQFRISRTSPAPIHDLVMIRLAKPVPLSRSISVACLPEETDQLTDGTLAFTAGWGHSSPTSSAVNEPRKARLKVSPRSCRQLMVDNKLHICGRNDRGNNICSGDSGSGLLIRAGVKSNNNQTSWKWHIFGVASFGLDECSQSVNHDNAFASIPVDVNWIRDVMNKY